MKHKRGLAFLLSANMAISLLPTFAINASAEDLEPLTDSTTNVTLTDEDKDGMYDIATKADLIAFSNLVNDGNTTINAELTADITFNSKEIMDGFTVNDSKITPASGAEAFAPIGKSSKLHILSQTEGITTDPGLSYMGTFDGNDHTISGIFVDKQVNAEASYYDDGTYARGLFGYVGPEGTVKNLKVTNSCVYGNCITGGIAGCLIDGTIENCSYIDSTVFGITNASTGYAAGIGGIVGAATKCQRAWEKNPVCPRILNCSSSNVKFAGNGRGRGGIAGFASGRATVTSTYDFRAKIIGCTANNDIKYTGAITFVGGIVGQAQMCYIENCTNYGNITQSLQSVSEGKYVGGIAGMHDIGIMSSCVNKGDVTCKAKENYVGGLAGRTRGVSSEASRYFMNKCYNTGNVTTSGNYVGGLVGANEQTDTANYYVSYLNSYNSGDIKGGDYVGGITGQIRGKTSATTIQNCYSSAKITATTADAANVGGIVGMRTGPAQANANYYNTDKYSGPDAGTTINNPTEKTNNGVSTEVFKSGEIAWSLQGSQTEKIWYQKIGTDDYPVLTGSEDGTVHNVIFKVKSDDIESDEEYTDYAVKYINHGKTMGSALPQAPSTEKYTFLKWAESEEGTAFTAETEVNADITLYAVGKEITVADENTPSDTYKLKKRRNNNTD